MAIEQNKAIIRILYIDDEVNNLVAFKGNFRREFTVFVADSAARGREILNTEEVHIIISDQRMPDMTGVEFFESILADHPDAIRILLTGFSDIEAVVGAINRGQVYKYINKPWEADDLRITITNAFEVYTLRRENAKLMEDLALANEQLEFLLRQKYIS